MGLRRHLCALALSAGCLAVPALAAAAGFDDPAPVSPQQDFTVGGTQHRLDKPNDPGYDRAENDPNDPASASSNLYDERYDLFGFPSKHTPATLYLDPNDLGRFGKPQISGFNASGAWKVTRGNPEVVIAILDTGIRWDNSGVRTQVRLNADELPPPQKADGTTTPQAPLNGYDLNGNGALDVDDYADDPRVGKPAPTGQDLIGAFSDGSDAEGNGFVDDVAGWDFFDDDNDPSDTSSYFAARNHGTGRVEEAVERANDGQGDLGVCPKCQYMPVRIWDTFVSDQTSFALGILYATDNGASVIEGADGGLYHSAFVERASDYAWERGVVQTYSGDDLNTGNHNYPAAYGHAMLIEGTATDSQGLGTNASSPDSPVGGFPEVPEPLRAVLREAAAAFVGLPFGGTEVPVGTYFRSSNTAQFGGKSSISMEGPTGSVNTGKASGAAGMVISAARDQGIVLTPDETRIILEQTAEDVLPLNTLGLGVPDPAQPGWDSHFGWGRVNLGKAVDVARAVATLPPEAVITAPDWYAPLTSDQLAVTGFARAPRAGGKAFRYKLEWGTGQAPTSWNTVTAGTATAPLTDVLGTIDLAQVRAALAAAPPPIDLAGPVFSLVSPNPFASEFTVRLTVTLDGVATPGVDRRVFNAFTDPTLRAGFPKRLGSGGEAPLRYGDLDGDNVQELVAPVEDGTIHAYRKTGGELPGWPVKTDPVKQVAAHLGSDAIAAVHAAAPGLEPPRAPVLVDLDADGIVEVATTAGRHLYVFNADGTRRDGFPVSIDPDFCRAEDQRQSGPSVHRKCGFLATPAAARLHGAAQPHSLVAPALDGHLYAWDGDGDPVENFPVDLVDPDESATSKMLAESINQPAIDDLNGDGIDDVVVATNESYGPEDPSPDQIPGLPASALSAALAQAGGTSRLYAVDGKTGKYMPGWPVKLSGAIQDTLPLIGPGHDAALATIDGQKVIVASTTGSAGIEVYTPQGGYVRSMQQALYAPGSDATDRTGMINLFESAIVADVTRGGVPAVVKYGLSLSQVVNLLLVGQNVPYNHLIGAWYADTGLPLPSFPRITDDYQFLSSSTVAKVATGPTAPGNQILAGTGLGLLHAYDGRLGTDVPGFPKVTGGWLFAPAELSADGRMATVTREGFLFEWTTAAGSCQPRGVWPTFRHDQQGSGNYDADGTPPDAVEDLQVLATGGTRQVTFVSPGDDRGCGVPAAYVARLEGGEAVALGAPEAGGTIVRRDVQLPVSGTLIVQARDEAGNLGHPARVAFGPLPVPTPTPDPATTATATPTPDGTATPTPDGTATATPTPAGTGPTQPPAGKPGTTLTPAPPPCRDDIAPASRFTTARITRRGMTLRGTAADTGCGARVDRVVVAVMRGGPGRQCRALLPGGRFSAPRSCLRTPYLPASGGATWTFRSAARLPAGNYTIWVRAIDRAGNVERKERTRNRRKLRLR